MVHLIDKSAVVAKIKYHLQFTPEHTNAFIEGEEHAYKTILSFIDSLQVKGVDLEKEIDIYSNALPCKRDDIEIIAKHFFELGLTTTNNSNKK